MKFYANLGNRNAFDPKQHLKDKLFDVLGLGEEPATSAKFLSDGKFWPGLLDPETVGNSPEEKLQLKREAVHYPDWRIVDLFVGGLLVVRTKSKEEIEPGDEPPIPPPDGSDDDDPGQTDVPNQSPSDTLAGDVPIVPPSGSDGPAAEASGPPAQGGES